MASWATMQDRIWGVLEAYGPLVSWLQERGGKEIKFAAGDRLRMDLTKFDLPALMVWLAKAESHWRSNAQVATTLTFAVQLATDGRDEREAMDFGGYVWQALLGQKASNFGLENLLRWTMEAGPLEHSVEERKGAASAAIWKMRVNLTLVVAE